VVGAAVVASSIPQPSWVPTPQESSLVDQVPPKTLGFPAFQLSSVREDQSWWALKSGARVVKVVRVASWCAGNPHSVLGRDSYCTLRCIPQMLWAFVWICEHYKSNQNKRSS
jgi:hypothetical protein